MAQIITINTADNFEDQAMVMGFREARQYDMSLPSWTELKIGILWSVVDSDTLTHEDGAFSEAISTQKDYFWFGLKTGNTEFPSNTQFIGERLYPTGYDDGLYLRFSTSHMIAVSSSIDTGTSFANVYIAGTIDPASSGSVSGPACWHPVKFTVYNKGEANQTIRVHPASSALITPIGVDGTANKYTESQIQNLLAGNYFNNGGNYFKIFNWNSGSTALPLPESLFIYCPLASKRLAIHGIGVQVVD